MNFLKKRLMSFESNYMSTNERIHSRYLSTKVGYLHQNIEADYDFDKKKLPLMLAMINAIVEDKKLELNWEAFR